MKVGDKVIMMNYGVIPTDIEYTILEVVDEKYIKVKHPEIGGYFQFAISRVGRVIPKK
jgi:hypothetical protein